MIKLAPKHFRLLSLMQERESVPADIMPAVMATLVRLRLAEFFCGEEWRRVSERYRLTARGERVLMAYDARIKRDQQRSKCQGSSRRCEKKPESDIKKFGSN
ncbi:hypothetical protein IBT49_23065 [Erwinia sp. S63]|uniref:hypothetical protein n=1 Tax=Erwinia sp. S63 TaxID=2769341 RepID=UPI00190B7098|nr:hypothetical protein [Erwinia sp. S63]MBK0098881.1 hypothetical protein [Erwinia sp. S63]